MHQTVKAHSVGIFGYNLIYGHDFVYYYDDWHVLSCRSGVGINFSNLVNQSWMTWFTVFILHKNVLNLPVHLCWCFHNNNNNNNICLPATGMTQHYPGFLTVYRHHRYYLNVPQAWVIVLILFAIMIALKLFMNTAAANLVFEYSIQIHYYNIPQW